ncbi:MAG: MFS transporter, partial [Gammaproteobacteria bacterium]
MRWYLIYPALVVVTLFYLLEFVARVEPSLAADDIRTYFGLSNSEFGTFASLFFFVYAPMQIAVGILLDRYGARLFAALGALCCGVGVILISSVSDIFLASIGRLITGFGASFAFVGALYVV